MIKAHLEKTLAEFFIRPENVNGPIWDRWLSILSAVMDDKEYTSLEEASGFVKWYSRALKQEYVRLHLISEYKPYYFVIEDMVRFVKYGGTFYDPKTILRTENEDEAKKLANLKDVYPYPRYELAKRYEEVLK